MEFTFWQLIILLAVISLMVLLPIIIGAFIVFRTKHAVTQVPFMQMPARPDTGKPESYVGDMFRDMEQPDDFELSPEARRIQEQSEDGLPPGVLTGRD
jgi:ABC-type glycerol-3-phosphate transport system permease component